MADGWRRLSPEIGEAKARELLYRLRPDAYVDRVLLAWARSGAATDDPQWRELATLPGRWRAPACPIKSKAFTVRGLAAGPQLGLALKMAEEAMDLGPVSRPDGRTSIRSCATR